MKLFEHTLQDINIGYVFHENFIIFSEWTKQVHMLRQSVFWRTAHIEHNGVVITSARCIKFR